MADDRVQINFRVPPTLRDRIDARAAQVRRSRNGWLEAAVLWALEQPVRTTTTRSTERT